MGPERPVCAQSGGLGLWRSMAGRERPRAGHRAEMETSRAAEVGLDLAVTKVLVVTGRGCLSFTAHCHAPSALCPERPLPWRPWRLPSAPCSVTCLSKPVSSPRLGWPLPADRVEGD